MCVSKCFVFDDKLLCTVLRAHEIAVQVLCKIDY